jgi:hypothetical protein
MIEIHGVSKKQCALLDTMWAFDSNESYEMWKSTLPKKTLKEVAVLEQMVIAAEIDNYVTDENLYDAKEIIERIK